VLNFGHAIEIGVVVPEPFITDKQVQDQQPARGRMTLAVIGLLAIVAIVFVAGLLLAVLR